MELPDLPAPVLKALMDIPITEDEWRGDHGFALLDVMHLSPGERCQLWITHRAELLRAWIEDRPGTRPQMWWHHDAPRQPLGRFPGWWCDGKVEQPRLRLGGIGTAALDAFDAQPKYHLRHTHRMVRARGARSGVRRRVSAPSRSIRPTRRDTKAKAPT